MHVANQRSFLLNKTIEQLELKTILSLNQVGRREILVVFTESTLNFSLYVEVRVFECRVITNHTLLNT